MTAAEFGQHYALELQEPLPSAQWSMGAAQLAAVANGQLKPPAHGGLWTAKDFMPDVWAQAVDAPADAPAPITLAQIKAQAKLAGMM